MENQYLSAFIHSAFIGFAALLPPVNPLGSALIVEPFIKNLSPSQRFTAALTIAFYSFALCATIIFFGSFFFHFFGISIPVVQLAGGFLICRMALESLASKNNLNEEKEVIGIRQTSRNVQDMLFFPLSFPTTTGGGTIAVLLALSANNFGSGLEEHLIEQSALILASFIMCTAVCICYYFAPKILDRLSSQGHQVADRLSGFLTFCVGLQILVNGITALTKTILK